MGFYNALARPRASPTTTTSVFFRRLRRLRVTAIFYTCLGVSAILLLVNFNSDVKRLLQQHSPQTSPSSPQSQQQLLPNFNQIRGGGDGVGEVDFPPLSRGSHKSNGEGEEQSHTRKTSDNLNMISLSDNEVFEDEGEEAIMNNRPWYMWGGRKYPGISDAVQPQAVDEARLWYEDNLNNDRIINQLSFWIDYTGGTVFSATPTITNGTQTTTWYDTSYFANNAGGGGSDTSGQIQKQDTNDDFLASIALSTGSVHIPSNQHSTFNSSSNRGVGSTNSLSSSSSSISSSLRGGTSDSKSKLKTILLYYGLGMSWGPHVTQGRGVFLQQKCPINTCRLTGNRAHMTKADVVLFKDVFMNPKVKRNPNQLWVMYMLECPLNTQNFADKNVFNLTATYRHDSDIVTPYEKWVYYNEHVKTLQQGVNYAEGKSKKVAWFVSNCVAKNNRLDYARELAKFIDVDIYGACGTHACSRANAKQCFDLLAKNYKFYLAFENSNCRDYISEKFFVNGLGNNVIPIVMGAHPDDYKRVAPVKSYIHVDDFPSAKELADYLHLLDSSTELYNEYFQWKGTGEFINTHFFCRLCAMAHYSEKSVRKPRYYKDFNKWWRGPNVCTRKSWRGQIDLFSKEFYEVPTTEY